jgi:hypothetical protein
VPVRKRTPLTCWREADPHHSHEVRFEWNRPRSWLSVSLMLSQFVTSACTEDGRAFAATLQMLRVVLSMTGASQFRHAESTLCRRLCKGQQSVPWAPCQEGSSAVSRIIGCKALKLSSVDSPRLTQSRLIHLHLPDPASGVGLSASLQPAALYCDLVFAPAAAIATR